MMPGTAREATMTDRYDEARYALGAERPHGYDRWTMLTKARWSNFRAKIAALVAAVLLLSGAAVIATEGVASAANSWPHAIVNGFSTPTGNGFWLVYANGAVGIYGGAHNYGNASSLPLKGPIVGGAVVPAGTGYWLVATDGGIFSYGTAHFYGSMGAARLNQPVFSMAPTKTGHGYWLVARDGGIFTFGDGKFYGSMGGVRLAQPITGITASPTGKGYRMVARDGGIFSFGDVPYYGSLPGLGIRVHDVVGMAPTPTGKGYWIARSGGQVYAFGDAHYFGNWTGSPCDPTAAIFSNPAAQGYRLVTQTGATIPFGTAPGGLAKTGTPRPCPPPPPFTFGDGTYVVGVNLPARTYRTRSSHAGCYWERLSGFGGSFGEIIANDFTNVSAVVTISATDKGFHTQDCGTWSSDLSRITSSPTAPFGGGEYIVGTDVAPGTWRSSGGTNCYWERLSGFGGTFDQIIANGLSNTPSVVTISATDRGFHATEDCGTWTKIG
jgi:hypothetical protein